VMFSILYKGDVHSICERWHYMSASVYHSVTCVGLETNMGESRGS
jgi:hypothetical protein